MDPDDKTMVVNFSGSAFLGSSIKMHFPVTVDTDPVVVGSSGPNTPVFQIIDFIGK
jgi:hypothetical protein